MELNFPMVKAAIMLAKIGYRVIFSLMSMWFQIRAKLD
jgi:hypothetical protein